MGKNRESGRSKSQPSSSSLAASLLPTGISNVGFGGYVGSSRVEAALSREEGPPQAVVDGELAQHLSRLGRKDPTTKVKALSCLSAIFVEKSEDELVQIIPQWAFEYRRLLTDYSREVRRATHETMTNLVANVRRGLAPHLRSLMGPWWLSQFDDAPEISQAARKSLEVAFPAQEKRLDALTLYGNEILLYLDENLKLTPQAMSDKARPADELEDMHGRVISLSLQAIATLLEVLLGVKRRGQTSEVPIIEPKCATKARMSTIATAEKIFSSHNYFLVFLKSRDPRVRSSTYTILGSFIKLIPQVFIEKKMKTLAAAVLGSLQEKHSSCHSSMWDMILLFSRTFPNCWAFDSVQKNALNCLCNFLRNGCYGSARESYPVFVHVLDLLPSDTLIKDNFILKFLESFWAGRNLHSSSQDWQAFIEALKECLLWGLFNVSRYLDGVDLHCFQVDFVDNVLVKLLWHDYMSVFNGQERGVTQGNLSSSKGDFNGLAKSSISVSYPRSHMDDVGRCILEILSIIFMKDQTLLTPFSLAFQRDCLDIFRNADAENFSEQTNQIANFFLLLETFTIGGSQTWALKYLAGPLIASTFPLVKTLDSPDTIRVLTVVSQVFGPQLFVLNLFPCSNGQNGVHTINDCRDASSKRRFFQLFEDHLVPWCLGSYTASLSSRLHLLVNLIDHDVFHDQWHSIIIYATSNEPFPDNSIVISADRAFILAILLENIRFKYKINETPGGLNQSIGFEPDQWKHKLLESAAISVVSHPSSISSSHARFLCALIGSPSEMDSVRFLSKMTVVHIFEAILKNLVDVLLMSAYSWVKEFSSLLLDICPVSAPLTCSSAKEIIDMALFSFKVLDSSFFCLNELDKDNKLVAFTIAAILTIDWESRMLSLDNSDEHIQCFHKGILLEDKNVVECDSVDLSHGRFSIGNKASSFRVAMSSDQWRSLSPYNLMVLRNAIVQIVRSAIWDMNALFYEKMPARCCSFILDVFELICPSHTDEQTMLDQLFSEGKDWPSWVAPDFCNGKRSATVISSITYMKEKQNNNFVAFTENLIFNVGVDRVLLGFNSKSTTTMVPPCFSYSRSWLAAELLCTWKWNGGSVLNSFLSFFLRSANDIAGYHERNFISSVISILLDGAILHGSTYRLRILNVWTISEDEIECLQGPFLRALVASLFTLIIKHDIWGGNEVIEFLRCLTCKLFIGTSINKSCLRVLPFLLNVMGNKMIERTSLASEDMVQSNILQWLQIALSLPPIAPESQTNEDLEGWIQVIVSLYPLNASEYGSFKTAKIKSITNEEKVSVLAIFHKQIVNNLGVSAAFRKAGSHLTENCPSLSIQMLLARLIAVSVGYFWEEFTEEDWDFVFCCLPQWIGLSVPMMEEIAEKIDDAVNSNDLRESTIKRIRSAIEVLEPTQMDLSLTALVILSLLFDISNEKQIRCNEAFHCVLDKWDLLKERILENVLRIFFSTGVAEAVAKSFDEEASLLIATSRFGYSRFWQLVASFVTCSAPRLRNSSVQSIRLWGLSAGAVSSLFVLVFSRKPMHALQSVAYHLLSTEPLSSISLYKESNLTTSTDGSCNSGMFLGNGASLDEPITLRDDISSLIECPSNQLLEMDLLGHDRVNFFLAWALLLSHLHSLPSSSLTRERLTQHIRDHISSIILDCIFQYIPVKPNLVQSSRKKDSELPVQVSKAANAAMRAITSCSLAFAVEDLWPTEIEKMATLAGSLYGLMIRLLPAYVSNWFSSLRDHSFSSAIESFTKGWCSPSLIADEFSQIKAVLIADDEFSVSVSKSAFEIVATYKKESGMDLVIRLPSCYPLKPVDVDCPRSIGISEVKQRKWLLSLTASVRNQNGALAEAIRVWKSNFDKEFLGVEECPICYSIINTTNHSLPRLASNHSLPQLACKTCKHKFHSACLYKWFSTSHKSLCPLCQMPF